MGVNHPEGQSYLPETYFLSSMPYLLLFQQISVSPFLDHVYLSAKNVYELHMQYWKYMLLSPRTFAKMFFTSLPNLRKSASAFRHDFHVSTWVVTEGRLPVS